jgi:adenosine deaminase
VQTGAIATLPSHPLRLYLNLGARVTINTDNRLITDTTVSKELWLAHSQIGLTLTDIKQVILNGFKSAFMPFHEKRRYLATVNDQLEAFHEDGTIDEALLHSKTALHDRQPHEVVEG